MALYWGVDPDRFQDALEDLVSIGAAHREYAGVVRSIAREVLNLEWASIEVLLDAPDAGGE